MPEPKCCNVCKGAACASYHEKWWCIFHALEEMERTRKLGEWAKLVRLVERANNEVSSVQ